VRLLLVGGSLRAASTNSAALRTVHTLVPGATLYGGLAGLPAMNPDDDADPPPAPVAALRAAVHEADAILFCTPEYAGALPGSFKNLLDWCIGDADPRSIYRKPVAWLNVSPRGAEGAHAELRAVLGYAHAAVVAAACADVPVTSAMIGPDGLVADPDAREAIAAAVASLVTAAAEAPADAPADA
jgi:chromate reductase, NAD(P)H dehydrogenase (quinone)